MSNVDELIRQFYKTNPISDEEIAAEERAELHKRLFVLTMPQFKALVEHFKGTEDGRKVKKFVDDELTRITEKLGINEEVLLSDIISNLAYQNPSAQEKPVMAQPMSKLEQEVLDQAMRELEDS